MWVRELNTEIACTAFYTHIIIGLWLRTGHQPYGQYRKRHRDYLWIVLVSCCCWKQISWFCVDWQFTGLVRKIVHQACDDTWVQSCEMSRSWGTKNENIMEYTFLEQQCESECKNKLTFPQGRVPQPPSHLIYLHPESTWSDTISLAKAVVLMGLWGSSGQWPWGNQLTAEEVTFSAELDIIMENGEVGPHGTVGSRLMCVCAGMIYGMFLF